MKNKALTLSIVIPVYNDKNHLKKCLDSIAKQSVMPDEVIVVDNNSNDGSCELARLFPFVRVIKEKKQGVVFARNAGFDAVQTDLIGRIDSDTILPVSWVEYIKGFYSNPDNHNQALTGGGYFYNIRMPKFTSWWQDQVVFRCNRLLLGHYILYGSNMAITREQWLDVRVDVCDNIDMHEDLDLAIHLHKIGYEITYHENLKVGVLMRRVITNRQELWGNMMWWPKTLKLHGKKTWVLGWLGAVFFYVLSPIGPITEKMARLAGRTPLSEN